VDNREIIQKADLALSDLATAGRLNEEQTNRFIRKLIDTPTILQACRTVTMNAPTRQINKIGFGSRILRPAVSSTALSAGNRVKPDLEQLKVNTSEVIAEINIPYDVIEDNIERGNVGGQMQQGAGGLHQTIVDLIAERAALDLEELGLKGDTASGDAYLALTDGWLKRSATNVVNAGGATLSKDVLKAAVKAMPDKYLRNRAALQHFVSVDNETELRDTYANRATALGDAMLQGTTPLYMHGSQVRGAAMMPGTDTLFTDPLNLIFGIWRNIQIEYDKDIRSRVFIIVLTTRVGFQIEEVEATVHTQNVLA
jgi:Phage capsid family